MLAPIDFIKEKYIVPNKITQDMLCDSLELGKKTISELYQHKRGFTLHTAKKFSKFFGLKPEFILKKQIEYDLYCDKKEYDFIKPYSELSLEVEKQNSTKWILSFINNSISDKSMHYSVDDLYQIFSKASLEKKYHYAIVTIFKEVNHEDVIKYMQLHKIPKENLKKLYEFYLEQFNSKEIPQYEWLLK